MGTAAPAVKTAGPDKSPQPKLRPAVAIKSRKPKSGKKSGKTDPSSQEQPVTTKQAVAGLRQVQDALAQLALAQAAQTVRASALEKKIEDQAEQARLAILAAATAQAERDDKDQRARAVQAAKEADRDARADKTEANIAAMASALSIILAQQAGMATAHHAPATITFPPAAPTAPPFPPDRKRQAFGNGADININSDV
jgi:hypothetical protein